MKNSMNKPMAELISSPSKSLKNENLGGHDANAMAMSKVEILDRLRRQLKRQKLDAFVLPRFDAHQSEYVTPRDERLAYVTGFTGSAGMALVTDREAILFVDGRYLEQARMQCADPVFSFSHFFENPLDDWIAGHASEGWRIGFDALHVPHAWYQRLESAANQQNATMVAVDVNPVDAIWLDRSRQANATVSFLPSQIAGKSNQAKADELFRYLKEQGVDYLVETQPDNIAWLLNIRGGDAEFTTSPHSYLIADQSGSIDWFVDTSRLPEGHLELLPSNVTLHAYDAFLSLLEDQIGEGQKLLCDPDFSPHAIRMVCDAKGSDLITESSILTRRKAVKNQLELEGFHSCHLKDGIAWVEFSAWLCDMVPKRAAEGHPVSDHEAELKIRSLRANDTTYLDESFGPISAVGASAAMCHFSASESKPVLLYPDIPYLLDSGAHYEAGTTDTTRCYAFADVSQDYREAYTAVFKAFHALATLRFPLGTQGHHVDAICRRPLWDLGLDYDHGTGHGVGHCLSVHEQPVRIGKAHNPVDLVPGMVLSIEPGFYASGQFGIRIENLFEIVDIGSGFCEFHPLTLVPIMPQMLNLQVLSEQERMWLEGYNSRVIETLSPFVSKAAQDWFDDLQSSMVD